jgi:putative nucleotidyltransferase with HDIG domain
VNPSASSNTPSKPPTKPRKQVSRTQPPAFPPPRQFNLTSPKGATDELILAALLHDIGQIIPLDSTREIQLRMQTNNNNQSVGRIGHETLGAEYLRGLGFSETVCRLVQSHVPAKRCVACRRLALHYHCRSIYESAGRKLTIADISRLRIAHTTIRCLRRRKSRLSSRGVRLAGRSRRRLRRIRCVRRWSC